MIYYKGKGEHSVNELETIIEQKIEELHQLYSCGHTVESESGRFMRQYNEDRKFCPNCGSTKYTITLAGFILDMENKEKYKNKNTCVCENCSDVHIFHDRSDLPF